MFNNGIAISAEKSFALKTESNSDLKLSQIELCICRIVTPLQDPDKKNRILINWTFS